MEYRDILGFKVSYDGKVIGRSGKFVRGYLNTAGYPILKVRLNGKDTSIAIHRLVAMAWIPNPENLPEVNHKDCDRTNFHGDNLEWCTHGYNVKYSYDKQNRSAVGANNARAKTTEDTAREICIKLSEGLSAAAIRDLGYDYGVVRAIKSRKNWQHISKEYNW